MSFKQWFKDHSDELPGDWGHHDIEIKEVGWTALFWLAGFIISPAISGAICLVIQALFHYSSSHLFFVLFALAMIAVLVFAMINTSKHINAIRGTAEDHSKEEWTVIERRITRITGCIIADIALALMLFGIFVHEMIALFK